MLRRTTPRRGFSLTEVLVALFVMAVGIISLLTLFPVGAVQMGHALRDDRAQTTVLQADARIRTRWQQFVLEGGGDDYTTALSNPGALQLADGHPALAPLAYPSYPVLYDPIGHNARGNSPPLPAVQNRTANVLAAAAVPTRGFPRRTAARLNLPFPDRYLKSFVESTMLDDLEFSRDPNQLAPSQVGLPALPNETGAPVNTLVRHGQYNWAALIQRPNNQEEKAADLKILVFHRRPPGIAPAQAEVAYPNPVNTTPVSFVVGSTQVVIPDTLDNLKIRVNGWILDGTIGAPIVGQPGISGTLTNGTQFGPPGGAGALANGVTMRHAHFHRIKTITEAGGSTIVELDTPIPAPWVAESLPAAVQSYNGRLYILDNLVEVFDRPRLAPNGYLPQVP
jgi:prepilin-type N-terminal cleavage/methylation domain-containing protein